MLPNTQFDSHQSPQIIVTVSIQLNANSLQAMNRFDVHHRPTNADLHGTGNVTSDPAPFKTFTIKAIKLSRCGEVSSETILDSV